MNLLTIDLEEWYIYQLYNKGESDFYLPIIESILDNILNLLDEYNYKASFFCLGIIARRYPKIIKKINERGHDIGCHSDLHTFISFQSKSEFRDETRIAIDSLQQLIGRDINMYRAPAFTISEKTKWALEVLAELNIEYDCSIFPVKRSFGGWGSFPTAYPVLIQTSSGVIKELPINYYKFCGSRIIYTGGGYFRLIPYFFIETLMKESNYNMAYFHIRDFDSAQKRVHSFRYLKSYLGVKGAFRKFEQIIRNNEFLSISQASNIINWDNVKTINV